MKKLLRFLIVVLTLCLFVNVKAKSYTEDEYKDLNILRGYVVCNYVFDMSEHSPTLSDLMIASQTCPRDNVSIYELKFVKKDAPWKVTDLLNNKVLDSFPSLDLKYIEKGEIGSGKETVLDSSPNANAFTIETTNIGASKFLELDVKRAYIVGAYVFDIGSYNPNLKDLLLASQTGTPGEAHVYEVKVYRSGDDIVERYVDLLNPSTTANSVPTLAERYVYYGEVKPTQHNSEAKIDLLGSSSSTEVSGISLSETSVELNRTESVQIEASVLPTTATNSGFTWTSSNEDVATVENGLITAKTGGTATITVTSDNGTTAEIVVTVVDDNKVATIICEDKVFNGSPQAIAVCSGGTVENHMQTYGGNYQVTCTGDDTHSDATPVTCKILRTDSTTTLSPKVTIYSGDVQPMTGAASTYNSTGTAINNAAYTYKYYSDNACTNDETTNAPINAGTYYVKAILTLNTDYNSSESPCVEYKVLKLDNTFTVTPYTATYTEDNEGVKTTFDADIEMIYSQFMNDQKVSFIYYSDSTCQTKTQDGVNAYSTGGAPYGEGTYYVVGVTEDNSNYNTITSECYEAVTINKTTATCPDIISYEGDYVPSTDETGTILRRFTVTTEAVGGTAMYCAYDNDTQTEAYCNDNSHWSSTLPTRSKAGKTVVKVKVVGDDNHSDVSCIDRAITINRIDNEIVLNYQSKPYTSYSIYADVSANEVTKQEIIDNGYVKYYLNDPYCGTTPVEPVNAGVYYVRITIPQTENYKETTYTKESVTCVPAELITPTETETTLGEFHNTYNGTPQPATGAASTFSSNDKDIATESGNLPLDTPVYTYTYYSDIGCRERIENLYAPTFSGNYYVTATLLGTNNYLNSTSACMTYEMKYLKDAITVNPGKNNNQLVVDYDGKFHPATYSTISGNDVEFTYYTAAGCDETSKISGDPRNAGSYYITATTKNDPDDAHSDINNITRRNYSIVELGCSANPAVIINKVAAQVTCYNNVYDKTEQVIAECDFGQISNHEHTEAGNYDVTCAESENHSEVTVSCPINKAETLVKINADNTTGSSHPREVYRDFSLNGIAGLDKVDDNIKSYAYDHNNNPVEIPRENANYTITYYTNDECTQGVTSTVPNTAGTHYVKAELNATNNYKSSSDCVPFIIKKIKATINVTQQPNHTYDGTTVEVGNYGTSQYGVLSYVYYTDYQCTLPTTTEHSETPGGAPKNVGMYYVKATSTPSDSIPLSKNYEITTAPDCFPAVRIVEDNPTCPVIQNYRGTYSKNNDINHPTFTVTSPAVGGTAYYKVDSGESSTNDEWVIDPPYRINAGTTTVHVKVENDNNHLTTTCPDATITIDKKVDEIKVNEYIANNLVEVPYDGNHHLAEITSESGAQLGIVYYNSSTCANNTQIAGTPINVGDYYVKVISLGNDNYAPNTPVCTHAVKINPVDAECPVITESSTYYDGQAHSIRVEGTAKGGTLKFSTDGTNWSTTNPTITNVNQSTNVTVKVFGDQNHNDVTCGTKALTIIKTNSTVTCKNNIVYTGSSQNLVQSCSHGSVTYNSTPINAGSYEVTCSGDGNHEPSYTTCLIGKSNTHTTLAQQTKDYTGSPLPASGATSTLDSTGNAITGAQYEYRYYLDSNCTKVTDTPKFGGTYYVKATLAATNNYNSSHACSKYVINQNKPPVTITCTTPTYNGNEQTIATCGNGNVNPTLKRTDAGSYEVICLGDDNYTGSTGTCTINKKDSTCPTYQSVTASYAPEQWHSIRYVSAGEGGIVEFKRDVCNWLNNSSVTIQPDCNLTWTDNFDQTYANVPGTTKISVRIVGDNNYNGKTCGDYTITIN